MRNLPDAASIFAPYQSGGPVDDDHEGLRSNAPRALDLIPSATRPQIGAENQPDFQIFDIDPGGLLMGGPRGGDPGTLTAGSVRPLAPKQAPYDIDPAGLLSGMGRAPAISSVNIHGNYIKPEDPAATQHRSLPGYVDPTHPALSNYLSGNWDIQWALRNPREYPPDANMPKAQALSQARAIHSLMSPLPEPMALFRGGDLSDFAAAKPGQVIKMTGLTSTSAEPIVARAFSDDKALLQIRAPKGVPAIITNAEQAEVILPHGTNLRFLGSRVVEFNGETHTIYDAEVVPRRAPVNLSPAKPSTKAAW